MRDGQNRCVKQESRTCIQQIQWRIEIITENGVPDAQHVDSQLVRSAGTWHQLHPCAVVVPLKNLETCARIAASFFIDDLPGSVVKILTERSIDDTVIDGQSATNDSFVVFLNLPFLKLNAYIPVRFGVPCKHDHA